MESEIVMAFSIKVDPLLRFEVGEIVVEGGKLVTVYRFEVGEIVVEGGKLVTVFEENDLGVVET